MRFFSASVQRPVVVTLLPLATESTGAAEGEAMPRRRPPAPSSTSSLPTRSTPGRVLPATVQVRLFKAFLDAAVTEQIARMVAMKAATDTAADMIKSLTREYNRARQTQITMEIMEIIGGANALS